MANLVGQTLVDKYRVLRLLGKGGMGQVYEVELVSLPDGMHFYVMEVLEGEDLDHRIKKRGPLSVPDVASLARQCFSGLLEAHRQGAVHRDLKPANVFLTDGANGLQVKIIDFGLARARDLASITVYTQPMLIGTPAYMSPDQISGKGPMNPPTAGPWPPCSTKQPLAKLPSKVVSLFCSPSSANNDRFPCACTDRIFPKPSPT